MSERLTAALTGQYRITKEIGAGGMATVFLAHDLKHDRQVAIKVLRPELAAVIGAERFLSEIKTTANLQHPHILPLFDSGAADGFLYYVMPYVEGESLRDRLTREHQLPISEAIRITTEVAGALDYAHRRGVIHRDIKPENILLHDGRALIADFGIALAASKAGGTRMTETGMSLGTPHYMAPEQAMGERILDARTDIYALGVVAYELLVGDPPFIGSTAQAIVAKVMTEKPTPISTVRDTIPAGVEEAILTALAKLPADRFASAAEFGQALSTGTTSGISRNTPTRGGTVSLAVKRKERRTTAALVALAGVATFAAIWGWSGRGTDGPAVYDAALPDTAPFSFLAPSGSASYGMTYRSISVVGNGRFGVYTAIRNDTTSLWLRDLRDASIREIPGTVGGGAPRISPDGTRLSFLLDDRLMVMPIEGGERREVFVSSGGAYSQGWLSPSELFVIDHDGYALTRVDVDGRRSTSHAIPRCIYGDWDPVSERLICTVGRYVSALALDSDSADRIFTRAEGEVDAAPVAGSGFRMIEGKYLVYLAIDGDLVAAPYDRKTYTIGRPVTLVRGIRREGAGEAQYDFAADGTLLFAPGPDGTAGRMVTLHRGGTPVPLPMEQADFQRFDLSRDRRYLAAAVQSAGRNSVRIYDLRDRQQYTWHEAETARHPLWSPGGEMIYLGIRNGNRNSLLRGYPGSARAAEVLYGVNGVALSMDFVDLHDDHLALVQDWTRAVVLRADPSRPFANFDTVLTSARFASLSPNAKLIAFQTKESSQIIVTSFPIPGRVHVLASRGVEPLWLSPSEVLYRNGFAWYSVTVDPATGEPRGAPTKWGEDPRFSDTSGWSNRPTWDGGIIYVQGPPQTSTPYLRVIPNWVAQMKRAVDAAN